MKKTGLFIVILIIAATVLTVCFSACSAASPKTEITDVRLEVKEKGGEINAKLIVDAVIADTFAKRNSGNIYLFRISPDNALSALSSLEGLEPVLQRKIKGGEISFTLPISGRDDISLASSYLLASLGSDGKYSPLTAASHIKNPEELAARKDPYPQSYSVKGCNSANTDISEMLKTGVRHSVVELKASEIAAGSLSASDDRIRALSESGINVFLRIIPDIESANKLYSAFLDAAVRYAGNDTSYGRVSSFIIGDCLNEAAGNEDENRYLFLTEKAVRLAYTAMRSVYSEGRVYISLGDNWESGQISSKSFITLFDSFAKSGGDYRWNVALKAGLDIPTGESVPSSTKIALENRRLPWGELDDVFNFMSGIAYRYNGAEDRHIMIDGGSITIHGMDSESKQSRAAALVEGMIYAENRAVDAMIYSGDIHADNEIYRAFSEVDIEGSCADGGSLSYVRGMLTEKFAAVYSTLNGNRYFRDVFVDGSFKPDYSKNGHKLHRIADFDGGIPENTVSINAGQGLSCVLSSDLSTVSLPSGSDKDLSCALNSYGGAPVGIHIRDIPADTFRKKNAVSVSLKAVCTSGAAKSCRVTVYAKEKDTHNSVCHETDIYTDLYGSISFDISEFAASLSKKSKIDLILIFRPADGSDMTVGVDSINTVEVVGKFSGNIAFILTVVILILIIAALIFEIIRQLFRARHRRSHDGDNEGHKR